MRIAFGQQQQAAQQHQAAMQDIQNAADEARAHTEGLLDAVSRVFPDADPQRMEEIARMVDPEALGQVLATEEGRARFIESIGRAATDEARHSWHGSEADREVRARA